MHFLVVTQVAIWIASFWVHMASNISLHRLPRWWYGSIEQKVFGFQGDRTTGHWIKVLAIAWMIAMGTQAAAFAVWWIYFLPEVATDKVPLNVWYVVFFLNLAVVMAGSIWSKIVWLWSPLEQTEDESGSISSMADLLRGRNRVGLGLLFVGIGLGGTAAILTLVFIQKVWLVLGLFCPTALMYVVALILSIRALWVLNNEIQNTADGYVQMDSESPPAPVNQSMAQSTRGRRRGV